jgi:hypothetical protein
MTSIAQQKKSLRDNIRANMTGYVRSQPWKAKRVVARLCDLLTEKMTLEELEELAEKLEGRNSEH